MIVDIIKHIEGHSGCNKLKGDDYLFVEYKCPINVEEFHLLSDSNLITYVISGKKDWIAPNETFELEAGDTLFVRKGVYSTKQYFDVPYCVMIFFINDNFIKNFMLEYRESLMIVEDDSVEDSLFKVQTDAAFTSVVESIFHYLNKGDDIPKSLVEIKFKELLFNICLNNQNRSLVSFFDLISRSTKTDIEFIMNQNFKYDLNMPDFARLCDRSLSSFKRDFKNYFNETPARWLTNKRLEYSKTLLRNTDLSVNEICYEVGFKSPSHFNTAFKSKFSLPPHKFKTNNL